MHKALYGRIKDELQLNIIEIGLHEWSPLVESTSGLHFGP